MANDNTRNIPRVLFTCGREPTYVRNTMIWQTLNRHFNSQLIADDRSGSLSLRIMRLIPRLLYQLRQPHDLVVIGFYGHPLVLLTKQFSRAPILFDPFVSTYDTLILDRQHFAADSIIARLCRQLDRRSLQKAQTILTDTQTHATFYQGTFDIGASKFSNLYVGCNEGQFYPRHGSLSKPFTVFTYSTYMPLHGIATIVEAAHLCQDYPIQFRIVGDRGPTYQQVRQQAAALGVQNIAFIPALPFDQLPSEIANASLCLGGHFGPTAKAGRVIAGKTYQFIAMKKAIILGDNPANRELFQHGDTAYLCPPNQPQALAQAIVELYHNPDLRHGLAERAYHLYRLHLNWKALGDELAGIVKQIV